MLFRSPTLKLVDLMGNEHPIIRANGKIALRLDSAPLFLIAGDGKALEQALRNADCAVSEKSLYIGLTPSADGALWAEFRNQAKYGCTVKTGGEQLEVPAFDSRKLQVKKPGENAPGVIYRNSRAFTYQYPGLPELRWATLMIHCYVPYAGGTAPDWTRIPAFPVPYHLYGWKAPESDFSARCQLAWNENNFFVRIAVRDSELCEENQADFKRKLESHNVWKIDGGLEFYINSSGKANNNDSFGSDNDDYRYDFCYPTADRASGRGVVYRRTEPDVQLMGATDAPSKEEAAQKVRCDFERTSDGYVYTITFPKDFLKPMALKEGSQAGISLSLVDIDRASGSGKTTDKRLCLTGDGAPNDNPATWANVTLVK